VTKIVTKELTPALWPDLETLFGKNGACAGCWCMFWRLEKGENLKSAGVKNTKRRFKKLVTDGAAHGVLAYLDGVPVGWCSFDKRTDYLALNRAPSLACEDAEKVWSLPCFFIKAGFRGKGVARALLKAALAAMKKRGAKIAEAYPVKPTSAGKIPAAFAYTGVPALFEPEGFELVQLKPRGKQRMRRTL
jgi:GNAT superfamily N-acetyltransferase